MRHAWMVLAFAFPVVEGCGPAPSDVDSESNATSSGSLLADEPAGARVLHARGTAPSSGASASPQMTWHGGPVLHSGVVGAIFWGSSWSSTTFAGDKISGIDSFYQGWASSNYAATATEYSDGSGHVGTAVSYAGHVIDPSRVAKQASRQPSALVAEVCAKFPGVVSNGFYAVYLDQKRGHSGYCAWHSWGTCANGTAIQVGMFFNLDGDAGCDPQSTVAGHSQGLAALANVSAHELAEALTDPHLDAWYDASGDENADKCAWTFELPHVTLSNGTMWKLQGEWSNAAYVANTGYPNRQGQAGCIQGGP